MRRVEHRRIALAHRECAPYAVDDDFDLDALFDGLLRLCRAGTGWCGFARWREAFKPDAVFLDTHLRQRGGDIVDHLAGTAQKDPIGLGEVDQATRRQLADACAVDAAIEQVDILRLARQQMDQREPLQEAILQILQRFEEHDRARCAVAIDQRDRAVRLMRQNRTRN